METQEEIAKTKSPVFVLFNWFFGVFFIFLAIAAFGRGIAIQGGMIAALGIILTPPGSRFLMGKLHPKFNWKHRFALIFFGFIFFIAAMPTKQRTEITTEGSHKQVQRQSKLHQLINGKNSDVSPHVEDTKKEEINKTDTFMSVLEKKLGKHPRWVLEVDEVRSKSISVTITYHSMPDGIHQVKNDTMKVARTILKLLVEQGRQPAEELMTVYVSGQMYETGETGMPLTRWFGSTDYDFNTDQLRWDPK